MSDIWILSTVIKPDSDTHTAHAARDFCFFWTALIVYESKHPQSNSESLKGQAIDFTFAHHLVMPTKPEICLPRNRVGRNLYFNMTGEIAFKTA